MHWINRNQSRRDPQLSCACEYGNWPAAEFGRLTVLLRRERLDSEYQAGLPVVSGRKLQVHVKKAGNNDNHVPIFVEDFLQRWAASTGGVQAASAFPFIF